MVTRTVSTRRTKGKQSRMKRFAPHLPYEDFPLFPLIDKKTGGGRWAKKVRGSLEYFGSLAEGWEAALEKYQREIHDLQAGRRPRQSTDGLTLKRLCDTFYEAKRRRHDAGELAASSLADYDETCKGIVGAFGRQRVVDDLDAQDFAGYRSQLAKRLGPVALGNEINRVRMVFGFGFKNGLIDRPMRFGSEFNRPSKKVLRLARAEKGPKVLTAGDVCKLIDAADVQLRAMILLGINAGLGNADVSALNRSHLDLEGGWLDFPRRMTGIARRCPLWPETVKAIREALAARREPADEADADAVFITKYRQRWVRGKSSDAVLQEFGKLLKAHGLNRKGFGFYVLRHVHRTVSDEVRDHRAAGIIMGHEPSDISTHYVETVSDARLKAVADHVRAWLYGKPVETKGDAKVKPKRKRKAKPTKREAGESRPRLRLVG
ncbi:MAG: tyrosine-type recombinase/integrase [Phycisphaeraceae bacterium]